MAQSVQINPNTPTPKSLSVLFAAHRQEYIDWSKQLLKRAKKILRQPTV